MTVWLRLLQGVFLGCGLGLLISCGTSPSPSSAPVVVQAPTVVDTLPTQLEQSVEPLPVAIPADITKTKPVVPTPASVVDQPPKTVPNKPTPSVMPELKATPVKEAVMADPLPRLTGIKGRVQVLAQNGEVLSPEGVIINLEPIGPESLNVGSQVIGEVHRHTVDMVNKTYTPGLMTVKRRDVISFSNKDKIKHNVFSSSGENTFDLGTYGGGEVQRVALASSGIVKVYCNIHPEMASFISVSDHNYSFITRSDGHFAIDNLPAGKYQLTAWHIRGEMAQTLVLSAEKVLVLDVAIDTSSFQPEQHKNKYGEDYKVRPVLFDDEFY